ncbi:MAG: DUF4965 domain-containing protein [Phycisphaera sp.]|nr:DUF4965 domain-containing protein [Phycisphaera sp.]
MLMMTWPMARFGSRFGLLFEPGKRRVMHSTLGRFLDAPLDLAVGLVEPDGTRRVLPFTADPSMTDLYGVEQFERINSMTFRGYSEQHGLRFEMNIHSPFYPQNEKLCVMPAMYVELRVTAAPRVRLRRFTNPPEFVDLFIRLKRGDTVIEARPDELSLRYDVELCPRYKPACSDNGTIAVSARKSRTGAKAAATGAGAGVRDEPSIGTARATERLRSLNEGAEPFTDADGAAGLTLRMPVTDEGSGVKWRLVWAAHTSDAVMDVRGTPARFRYTRHWDSAEEVLAHAEANRDEYLALSRRFEKLLQQAPLSKSQAHLLTMAFQSFLANTFWCEVGGGPGGEPREWFSVAEGSSMYHSTVDVEYNVSLFYLTLWPRLLAVELDEWAHASHSTEHKESGGLILNHDTGRGLRINGRKPDYSMPVEENANYLLLMQAYAHWTGDTKPLTKHAAFLRRLAMYLLWSDGDRDGFSDHGTSNTLDGSDAVRLARKQTYLAIKRVAALDAAADLLSRAGDRETADLCRNASAESVPLIEHAAWIEDHYVVSVDRDTRGLIDSWTGKAMPTQELVGWDDYSIYTSNGLLLPQLIAQPIAFDQNRLTVDMVNSQREALCPYGCGHTSGDSTNIWISSNLWRDFTGRYLDVELMVLDPNYWDLLVYANTGSNSFGYIDTYIGNELAFYPRGATALGYYLAGPRLQIDRLDGEYFAVKPDRHGSQRWPLLPLADWDAGKIPVCVVEADGSVQIEGEINPVKVHGHAPVADDTIG